MKFKLVLKTDDSREWEEEYEENTDDPLEWGRKLIDRFNKSLKLGESKREVVDVTISYERSRLVHIWEKTNLVTISNNQGSYDTARCSLCGVTGKRFGLGQNIRLDPKYKKMDPKYCNKKEKRKRTRFPA